MWFWLARIISGRSQQDRTRRGLDKGSVPIRQERLVQPVFSGFFIQSRLIVAIRRLLSVVACQVHFEGDSQATGISIRVGRRIFSIVGDLGFLGGPCRGFGRWLLARLILRWLHMLRRQEEVSGQRKSLLSLVEGPRGRGQ